MRANGNRLDPYARARDTMIELLVSRGISDRRVLDAMSGQDDPTLEGVAAIVFDEFHERHLAGDLGLALALDVQAQLREDLRIVVMSATLDGEKLARFLDAPRLTSAGRSFPVTVAHFPARRDEALNVLMSPLRRPVAHHLVNRQRDIAVHGQPRQKRVVLKDDATFRPGTRYGSAVK